MERRNKSISFSKLREEYEKEGKIQRKTYLVAWKNRL